MPKKKKAIAKTKTASVRVRGGASARTRGKTVARSFGHLVLPAIIILILAGVVIFMFLSGYQTATASPFFSLRNIDIQGTNKTSKDEIARIVSTSVEKPGVWNADLSDIRTKIEKFPFVKSAAVSRMLPAGIRVNITERVPAAVVQLNSGKYLIDVEGTLLTAVKGNDKDFPFVLRGWDESKTEKAVPDNLARLKVYKKMLDEWQPFDLATRVKEVNLSNPRDPVAVVEDSGHTIAVTLARDNLGKSLRTAIEALAGKGARVKSVDAGGIYPVLQYQDF